MSDFELNQAFAIMGACSRAILTATLLATVTAQTPDYYEGGSHVCGSDNIPFASNVMCDNYCGVSVEGYGSTIDTNSIDESRTVSAFYMGGFF